jgi:hypothetical protein
MALAIADEPVIIAKIYFYFIIFCISPLLSHKTKQTHSHTFDTLFLCLQWEEWMCPCGRLGFSSSVLLL